MKKVINKIAFKTHEILFLMAGLGILVSLPFIETGGLSIWMLAKIMYFLGILFFIINIIKEKS